MKAIKLEKLQQKLPKRVYHGITLRLCRLNQRSYAENLKASTLLSIGLFLVGAVYFAVAYSFFHSLWYHKLLSLGSAVIFVFLCREYYFEHLERKLKSDLPGCCKKLSHYYTHYRGSVIPALKGAEEKGPSSTKIYMVKIRQALESVDAAGNIDRLKRNMPHAWLKMLCSLLLFAKSTGEDAAGSEGRMSVIGANLRRLTRILSFLNIEQGYNDADLLGIEIFLFFAPFLFIPASEWFNAKLLMEVNMGDVYKSVEAQSLKAMLFLVANVSAVFVHWMRRQQGE